ncbi:hypothetical protein PYCCODRAFT_1001531 [Trametes coccinea BRFM310]|uniref:Uncharacterized protein n=1 Tax=Trametes coccinea (strain BRFM310) TaxID=1353009 RepID=A0A1Y2IEZ6_TRAC3|nr:hypothetical protein PYCCODRAFT_1001531 [Trametes coccinea BRFM310]
MPRWSMHLLKGKSGCRQTYPGPSAMFWKRLPMVVCSLTLMTMVIKSQIRSSWIRPCTRTDHTVLQADSASRHTETVLLSSSTRSNLRFRRSHVLQVLGL